MAEMIASLEAWLNGLTGYSMSIHGYIAIVLTFVGVAGLYGVLLWLMRKSRDSNLDYEVYTYKDPRKDPEQDP